MGNFAVNFAIAHKDYFVGIAIGYSAAHVRQAFDYAYDKADSWPPFHAFIVKYGPQIEQGIADAADEAKKKIEESKAKDAAK